MNDKQKTLTFVGIAVAAIILAAEPWKSLAKRADHAAVEENAGKSKKLFPDFADARSAKSLEVMQFNEETGEFKPFKIASLSGVWSIPSHQNYPADATEHLAKAATSLIDLTIQGAVPGSRGDHATYGLIEPDPNTLKAGTTGVGTRVTMRDAKDKALADLIVGKADTKNPQLHFVRRQGQDQVYRVKIDTSPLSTKFQDWIEKDLLKINTFDIRSVQLNDYSSSVGLTQQGELGLNMRRRSEAKLDYNDEKSTWNLSEFTEFDKGQPKPGKLGEDEELNTEKLNALKTALDDLKIVDVERKPEGLSSDLRGSEDFVKNREAMESLFKRGFFPVQTDEGKTEFISSEGEAICRMKDGVEYILRFGNIAAPSGNHEEADPKDKEDGKDTPSSRLNRYLFIMARFNPDMLDKPKVETPPGDKAEEKADAGAKGEDKAEKSDEKAKPADEANEQEQSLTDQGEAQDQPSAPVKKPAPAQAPVKATPPKKDPAKKAATDTTKKEPAAAEPAKPETTKPADAETSAKPAAEPTPETKPAAAEEKPPAEKTAAEKEKEEEARAAAAEKLRALEKENKRKQTDYEAKVKKGEERVQELNTRFADWYYVISDDVYKKIHLSRADFVKSKEKEKGAGKGENLGDLKELEKGLNLK